MSLQLKHEWKNGILENSPHAKFHIMYNGNMEMISGYGMAKFRKTKVKSVDNVMKKLIAWGTVSNRKG